MQACTRSVQATKGRRVAVKDVSDRVILFEKQVIKTLIHPPKWRRFRCIENRLIHACFGCLNRGKWLPGKGLWEREFCEMDHAKR